jgi:hypothetical protein
MKDEQRIIPLSSLLSAPPRQLNVRRLPFAEKSLLNLAAFGIVLA